MSDTKPPFDVALPKITADIREEFGSAMFLIQDEDWTQEAVDFAAEIVRPAVQARIAQLEDALSPKSWIFNCVKPGMYSVTWSGRELVFRECDGKSTPVYAAFPLETGTKP